MPQQCLSASGRFAHAHSSLSFFPGQCECGRRSQREGEISGRTVTKVKEDEKSWHWIVNSSIASPRHWTWNPSSLRSCHLWNIDFRHLHQFEDIMPENGWELLQSAGIACWILKTALGDAVGIVFMYIINIWEQDYWTRGELVPIRYISHHI